MDVARRLPQIAAKLFRKAKSKRLSITDLKNECPWICQQIAGDAATKGLFDLWGQSSNFDELARTEIVEPRILSVIGELAGIPMEGLTVHAGLQHTYGYLLSTIVTPFGYKRDRWLSPRLEQGFGLPPDVLGPAPSQGTLLANATVFAGSIAFRGNSNATKALRKVSSFAATAIRKMNFARVDHTRITESVSLRDSLGRFRSVRIQTDLIPFPHAVAGGADNWLLVYACHDSSQPGPRLITLFTISPTFAAELTDPVRFGPAVEIRTRFNAYVAGISGKTLIGRRGLQEFPAMLASKVKSG